MKIRPIHTLATWACLAACLLIGAAPAGGLVLCVGSDGHVGVGSAAAGCEGCPESAPTAEGGPRPEWPGIDADAPCCPCLDVPVMSGRVAVPGSPRLCFGSSPLLATPTPLVMSPERPTGATGLGPHPPVAAGSALARLRSVILRT